MRNLLDWKLREVLDSNIISIFRTNSHLFPIAKQVSIAKIQVVTYELSFIEYLILGYCLLFTGNIGYWLFGIDMELSYLCHESTFGYYVSISDQITFF